MVQIVKQLTQNLPNSIDRSVSVIAGGAVANLLYNEAHKENAPINDIDIFVFNKRSNEDIGVNQDGAFVDYIGDIQNTINNLKILDTKRDGIFNIINVEVDHLFDLNSLGRQLISQFDINATQAFINLNENNIVTLEGFDSFIKTKQIKAVSVNTPVKTILRLMKKKKELNCYFDENQIKILFQFARFKNQRLTEESFEKFSNEISLLKDYFRIFKMSDKKYTVFLNRKKHNIPLHRGEKNIIKTKNNKILLPVFEEYYKNSKLYKKYLRIRPYRKTTKFVLEKQNLEQYLKNDFNEKELVHVEKVMRQVSVLSESFSHKSLNDIITFSKELNKIKNKDLFLYTCGKLVHHLLFDFKEIKDILEKIKKEYSNSVIPLINKLDIKVIGIKELNSEFLLNEEGRLMGHCVGGYSSKVKAGFCRIFSIQTEIQKSTIEIMEIEVKEGKTWVGVQHRTKFNQIPCKENRLLALKLLNSLNNIVLESDESLNEVFGQIF